VLKERHPNELKNWATGSHTLVLQPLDGVEPDFVWQLNRHIRRADLTIILTGDPERSTHRAAAAVAGWLGKISTAVPGSVLGTYVDGITTSLTAAGTPRQRRRPASDDHLRLVAALYAEALAAGQHRTPARYVEQQLRQRGVQVSARGGRDQVRKWIQRARERGFIPPA
jgi:hypothetical protein